MPGCCWGAGSCDSDVSCGKMLRCAGQHRQAGMRAMLMGCSGKVQSLQTPGSMPTPAAEEEGAWEPLRACKQLVELRLPNGALSAVPDVITALSNLETLSFRGESLGGAWLDWPRQGLHLCSAPLHGVPIK